MLPSPAQMKAIIPIWDLRILHFHLFLQSHLILQIIGGPLNSLYLLSPRPSGLVQAIGHGTLILALLILPSILLVIITIVLIIIIIHLTLLQDPLLITTNIPHRHTQVDGLSLGHSGICLLSPPITRLDMTHLLRLLLLLLLKSNQRIVPHLQRTRTELYSSEMLDTTYLKG